MKMTQERFLTSHTGSLPRPADLVALLNAKELGEGYEETRAKERVRSAILEIVRRQARLGVDVINDGEHSKVNWMAYAALPARTPANRQKFHCGRTTFGE